MERLLGSPSTLFWDKIKNVVFGFAIIYFWVLLVVTFLDFLNTPAQVITPQVSFFFSCIMAPLWEEVIFRLMPITLARRFDERLLPIVVVSSSIIFGIGHGYGIVSILIQGMMGFIFACTYLKNGNIIYAMLLHSAWNIYCFIQQ